MRMNTDTVLHAIKTSKGTTEGGLSIDSCTFYLDVDLAESSWGESWGSIASPFKFGTSEEAKKWEPYRDALKEGKKVPVRCAFDVRTKQTPKGPTNELVLLAIAPMSGQKGAAAPAAGA